MNKILVIEEKGIIRKGMVNLLSGLGCNVEVAGDGEEGLEKVKRFNPDCIITAILLPKIGGLELIMNVRALLINIPIIALCKRERFGHCDYLEPARQFGANDVLVRPFQNRDLVSSVQKLIRDSAAA